MTLLKLETDSFLKVCRQFFSDELSERGCGPPGAIPGPRPKWKFCVGGVVCGGGSFGEKGTTSESQDFNQAGCPSNTNQKALASLLAMRIFMRRPEFV